jgi:multidrug efflux pump subunit AcrA (membrane-fusion protein)
MAASAPDLTKLRIDRDATPIRRRRRRRWIWLAIVAVISRQRVAGSCCNRACRWCRRRRLLPRTPSQQFVVLNATGYVVAQRKASISSKATGRLEWLGVAEGSRVKAGDIIARIDDRDVVAQAQSVEASVRAARANVAQAEVEAQNAQVEYQRNADLVDRNFISKSALDNAKARLDRGRAVVNSAQGEPECRARERAQRAGFSRLHADPRALRWCDPVEERQRRRPRNALFECHRFQGCGGHDGGHEHAGS